VTRQKRIDPVSRSASGVKQWDRIRNLDPSRYYVLANPNDELSGVPYYLALGYEVEKVRKDGPVPKVARTMRDGDEITVLGQVLMSCPRDEREAMDAESQSMVTAVENRILKTGGVDSLRGFRDIRVVNETEQLILE